MTRAVAARVDHNLCVGNAMCRAVAPKAFVEGEDGQSIPADPNAETLESVLEAAAICPVGAITLTDADTGEEVDF
jgi:ferredoxin